MLSVKCSPRHSMRTARSRLRPSSRSRAAPVPGSVECQSRLRISATVPSARARSTRACIWSRLPIQYTWKKVLGLAAATSSAGLLTKVQRRHPHGRPKIRSTEGVQLLPGTATAPASSWRAPAKPSSRRDVRHVRQAVCGRRHTRLRVGGLEARQPEPPPASRHLEHGGADRPGPAIHVLLSKTVAGATALSHQLPPRQQARLRMPS